MKLAQHLGKHLAKRLASTLATIGGGGSPGPEPFDFRLLPGARYWLDTSVEAYSDAGVTAVTNGQLVHDWVSQCGSFNRRFRQATSAQRPTFASGSLATITGDGAASGDRDTLPTSGGYILDMIAQTDLPDASGGQVGKGFTCTGLCYIETCTTVPAYSDCFAVANDGRGTSGDPHEPSIVIIRRTDKAKVGEIVMDTSVFSSMGSLQGIAWEPVAEQFYIVSLAESLVRVFDVDSDGTSNASSWSVPADTNGLCIDPVAEKLYTLNLSGALSSYNYDGTGVTALAAMTGRAVVDHLTYVAGTIYATVGSNGSRGGIVRYNVAANTWAPTSNDSVLTEALAVEGIVLLDDRLYVANDGFFHATGTMKNEILEYDWPGMVGDAEYTHIEMFFRGNLSGTTLPTVGYIFASGAPLVDPGFGLALLQSNSTSLRLYVNTAAGSTERAIGTVTASDLTADSLIRVSINLADNVARIYQNGSQVGSDVDLSVCVGTLPLIDLSLFAAEARQVPWTCRGKAFALHVGVMTSEEIAATEAQMMS